MRYNPHEDESLLKEVEIVQLTGPRSSPSRMWATMSDAFWLVVLAVIVLFAFFLALGAFGPGDVAGLSIAVGILVLLWIAHSIRLRRKAAGHRDAASMHARERRGF